MPTLAQEPHGEGGAAADIFATSDQCIACHSNLSAPDGGDVSIGYAWRASMMANAARDPYWHAGVRREVMDHPAAQAAIEDKCSTCHMPMMRFGAAVDGGTGQVFANLPGPDADPMALDGVSCTVCHQITPENFGERESFEGGFSIDTTERGDGRAVYGPHDVDDGLTSLMQTAGRLTPTTATHLQQSEMCATCHTLFTNALNDAGEVIGELAEQVPFLEWRHSSFRETQSCQDCHMPELAEPTAISSVLGQPRPDFSQHVFRGGNAFMMGILNRHRDELGVTALPQEFDATIRRTIDYLQTSTATLAIDAPDVDGDALAFDIVVLSLAGHKLPTAYPSRRVWLHVTVTGADGSVLFESGSIRDDGSIVGNDNDDDGSIYEPHYAEITEPGQVQIYEPILGDEDGGVTTGLLRGVSYLKDNRILPDGFDKATAEHAVAVNGRADADADFVAGSDRVRFRLDIDGARAPVTIAAELRYQTIGFRWADNLREYSAAETDRFVEYYEEAAPDSSVELAAASMLVR